MGMEPFVRAQFHYKEMLNFFIMMVVTKECIYLKTEQTSTFKMSVLQYFKSRREKKTLKIAEVKFLIRYGKW